MFNHNNLDETKHDQKKWICRKMKNNSQVNSSVSSCYSCQSLNYQVLLQVSVTYCKTKISASKSSDFMALYKSVFKILTSNFSTLSFSRISTVMVTFGPKNAKWADGMEESANCFVRQYLLPLRCITSSAEAILSQCSSATVSCHWVLWF